MDDEELSSRLTASTPSIAPRGDRVRAAIDRVVTESRPPRRPRKRLFISGAALSVALLGGTSAALASPSLLEWLSFTPDHTIQHLNAGGDFCAAGLILRPEGVPDTDPSYRVAKRTFLAIDFETLEIPEDIRKHSLERQAASSEAIAQYNAANPEATVKPARPDPESDMLIRTAHQLVANAVKAQGLDDSHFSLEAGGQCDEATR